MNKLVAISLFVLCAPAICAETYSPIDPAKGCKGNPEIVGKCFAIRGQVHQGVGTPGMRIWRIGTKRILGVLPDEEEIAPASVKAPLAHGDDVYANLVVCPFTRKHPSEMQMVCIESAKNIRLKKP